MSHSPRVRCHGCAFAWYGATAAHGLRIVGSCPRCGAALEFLEPLIDDATPDAHERWSREEDDRAPATVLGIPLRR